MRRYSILMADDEDSFRELVRQRLTRKGYLVTAVASGTAALQALAEEVYDAAIFDLRMPGATGIEVLHRARTVQPSLQVLILTGHGSIESAVEAIRTGAYDYLTKPCNLAELELTLQKALEHKALEVANQGLRESLRRQGAGNDIIGNSPEMQRLLELTGRVAATDTAVLIEGESGTGKELIAQAVHRLSHRSAGPFIPVNCGALPGALLESELFGHAKGAFTGAQAEKPGLVELAEGGTLFLDEIGELPLELQSKLLRFLESHELRRVGENKLRRVDARIVAATNRHLADEVRQGRFREDLFYRLGVVVLSVPPLRERRADVPLLVAFFLARLGAQKEIGGEALEALMHHDFPGNVRELYNLVQRGIIFSPDRYIVPEDLGLAPWVIPAIPASASVLASPSPPTPPSPSPPTSVLASTPAPAPTSTPAPTSSPAALMLTLAEMERHHIAAALAQTGWNRAQAAQLLGISVRNLYRKIDAFALKAPDGAEG